MGLTIHYGLTTKLSKIRDIRTVVGALRQFALDLPFQEVDDLMEVTDSDAGFPDRDDPRRWLMIQAGQHVQHDQRSYRMAPTHVVAFATVPGPGCESANFGLCRYPRSLEVPADGGRRRRILTRRHGWSWSSFCKTQYASNPDCGGLENFLRCHLLVIKMLDFAHKTGVLEVEVGDESGYWDRRDLKELAGTVGHWNQLIAAVAGRLKDQAEGSLEATIMNFPDFERLAAKGLKRLEGLSSGTAALAKL